MINLTLISAFIAGVISFFSPCVLPLLPGFLIHISQAGLNHETAASRSRIFLNSLFYVLGFSVIFAFLGVLLNAFLPSCSNQVQTYLSWVGGAIIIFFGLYSMGLFKIPLLAKTYKFYPKRLSNSNSYLSSFIFGAAFAVGWTPCVGAILGAVLTLAITNANLAFYLLLAYALGIGIPFLVLGAFTSQSAVFIKKLAPHLELIQKIAGVLLVIMGVLIATQKLLLLSNLFVFK